MRISAFTRFTLLALLCTALASCSTTTKSEGQQSRLVGCWLGEDFQPVMGESAKWLMNRKPDGTFKIEFQSRDGTVQREEGTWLDQGSNYTTVTLRIDGEPVDVNDTQFTDTYEIRSVTNGVMEYYHTRMNITFKAQKVECAKSDA
jgi:hypothetical protein